MRIFTSDEQNILRRINELEVLNFFTLISPWIEGVGFRVDTEKNNVRFSLEGDLEENTQQFSNRLQEIQFILVQSVNLLKLFEEKGYIFLFKNTQYTSLENPFFFGRYNSSSAHTFPDNVLSELIVKYSAHDIFATDELNHFITNDNFQTRERAQANRQYRLTLSALIVAIVALLFNLVFNIYNSFFKPLNEKIIIQPQGVSLQQNDHDTVLMNKDNNCSSWNYEKERDTTK